MNDKDNQGAQKTHRLFRQEQQRRDGAVALKEYAAQEDATRRKTAKLRALRLARDAATEATGPPAKPAKKAASRA